MMENEHPSVSMGFPTKTDRLQPSHPLQFFADPVEARIDIIDIVDNIDIVGHGVMGNW
jgi:hypothetical protein